MMTEQNTGNAGERGACCGRGGGGGKRHRHRDHCCGGRHSHEAISRSDEAEIGELERQIAASQARLAELRRQ